MIDQYLLEHSLDPAFVKSLGWAWGKDDNKITIPVYDAKGKLMYCRYRHLEGTIKFTSDKGSHPALYCLHKIKNKKEIVLCEGEPDCARLWQENIPAITGTTGVKTFSNKLAAPLKGKTVLICLDTDEAGQSAIPHYYNILESLGCFPKIILLPHNFKDISEYFTNGGTNTSFNLLPRLTINEWFDLTEPETFALETANELIEQEIPEEEWLVDRVLPIEGFCFFVGAEATGKTFYTLTLANAVATGTPWLNATDKDGNKLFTVKNPQKVLIIDKENTKRRIQSRMKWMNIDSPNIYRVSFPHFFDLVDPEQESGYSLFAQSLSRKVKQLGIKLVIVDAFTDLLEGNENDRGDVQKFFDAMRQLFPNTSILCLHHASKPSPGVIRTAAQRTRGSTNINAQVYSMFFVESLPKSKSEFVIEQTKAGDSEKLNRFIVELDVQPIENSNGKTKVVGIIHKGDMPDEEMKAETARLAIEEAFTGKGIISRQEMLEICQASGISQRTTIRQLKEMIEEGLIDTVPDIHNRVKKNYIWKQNEIISEE